MTPTCPVAASSIRISEYLGDPIHPIAQRGYHANASHPIDLAHFFSFQVSVPNPLIRSAGPDSVGYSTGWGRQPKCPAKFHELSKNFTNFE